MNLSMRLLPWLVPLLALAVPGLARAEVKTEAVNYHEGDATLKGFLAYNTAAKGKRPGIVVVPEWWGLNDYPRHRAEQLAGLGYVALAADIYGDGQVAATPEAAGKLAGKFRNDRALLRARVLAAVETLRQDPHVDPTKIACIGYCFGGTAVLELARSGAGVAGVVSIHGGLDPGNPADTTEKIRAKVLVLHGADDKSMTPEVVLAFQDEMRKAGADWQFISYGGAVHGFSNPANDKLNTSAVKYNAAADHRSWQAMLDFFHEIFQEK